MICQSQSNPIAEAIEGYRREEIVTSRFAVEAENCKRLSAICLGADIINLNCVASKASVDTLHMYCSWRLQRPLIILSWNSPVSAELD